jgi:hypothetical protein
VSRRAPRTMRSSVTQAWSGGGLLALKDTARELCSSLTTPSPEERSFPWQEKGNGAEARKVWFTHSPLVLPRQCRQQDRYDCCPVAMASLYMDAHQQGVSVERHLSRIFPAHPRSLARCLSRARRHSAFCFALSGALRVWVSKQKSPAQHARGCGPYGRDFSSEPPQKDTPSALGSGAHSRRFAQECPEGNPGKYKTGETQWHSTKTRSR